MYTILVIEDDADLRTNLEAILSGEGYKVLVAEDGLAGYDLAVIYLPDLIVADIYMPYCDGYELLNKLQNNPATAWIQFIFLTAKAEIKDIRKGMSIGADDYLTKPFDMDDLLDAIRARLMKNDRCLHLIEEVKDSLIRKVPHELRTPLVGILGFSEFIENDAENLSREDLRSMAGKIRASGNRLLRRIEKFLIYTELTTLVVNNTVRLNNISEIYEPDTELLAAQLRQKAADVGRESDLTTHLGIGRMKISQRHYEIMLNELLENSLKFSGKPSPIVIRALQKNGFYVTSITDCGVGLNNADVANIGTFNFFGNSDISVEGVGLGLVIVKKILDLYGGFLEFDTEENGRTVVRFGVPV